MKKILVSGIVQGVGFRPFVYRIATELNLKGYVRNLGNVVEIILNSNNIDLFLSKLKNELPPIAKINSINIIEIEEKKYSSFEIIESSDNYSGVSVIPPDIAICDKCLEEIRNPNNRRYKYPFNACTDCGPRFTVIESVPYDRNRTTMDRFPLCNTCIKEYKNPLNRRYHGEAICCEECGPQMKLNNLECENPIYEAAQKLSNGKILAIKGIGGTHLVVDAKNEKAISKLRKKLGRLNQAFAVMSKDIRTIQKFAKINFNEKKTLLSNKRPIVILKKNENYNFPENLAPGLHNIGVMLPYSPMHYLLFDENEDIDTYVMTSANVPGEPMMISNEEITMLEDSITDYSLIHNRKILNRCDDSVIRFRNNDLSFIRRSRGYTPEPYEINYDYNDKNVLALGPELDVTFSIAKDNLIYPSQHIGNTNKFKTFNFLKEAIENMTKITKIKEFNLICCDLHPQFITTKYAKELSESLNCDILKIQHHHAHSVALANDYNLEEMITIAADGVGYGDDGTSWGGEILYTDLKSFKRLAHLKPQIMPGGDMATKYPVRMLASILYDEFDNLEELLKDNYSHYFKYGKNEIDLVLKQINSKVNIGLTSSTGRILDSIAVALNICGERTYEGECSMKLESFAYGFENTLEIPYEIKKGELNTSLILKEVVDLYLKGENPHKIASAAQSTIAKGLSELAIEAALKKNIENIGVTGGVFYNEAITETCKNYIEQEGFNFIQHKNSCCGDGSVSLGQAIVGKLI